MAPNSEMVSKAQEISRFVIKNGRVLSEDWDNSLYVEVEFEARERGVSDDDAKMMALIAQTYQY